MSNAAKNVDILAINFKAFYIIILIVQQITFLICYPTKVLDLSAKSFFPYVN